MLILILVYTALFTTAITLYMGVVEKQSLAAKKERYYIEGNFCRRHRGPLT